MSFKGTEGKWTVIDGKASGKQVISESAPKNRMIVASCGGQRREENANLIAAAPELLDALQKIVAMNEQYCLDKYGDSSKADTMACVTTARAAISKALGQ